MNAAEAPIQFLLASQSPRRRELVTLLGYPVTAVAAHADEESITTPDPALNVIQTAELKTAVITTTFYPPANTRTILITADTTVVVDGEMLNKPRDTADAQCMLMRLRNRNHEVHTGFVLLDLGSGQRVTGVHTAVVTMRRYTDAEIDAYIATGDPMDKAGAYAIQHPVFRPVSGIQGCYLGVMGLPLCDLILVLRALNVPELVKVTAVHQAHQHYPCPVLNRVRP